MRITTIDWIIFAILTGGLLGIGIWTRLFVKGVADFTVGGRKMGMWLGLGASSADGIAIASIVAVCQQAYLHGFSYAWLRLLGPLILVPLIGIYGFGIKRYRATCVQTLPQYYEMRYSKGVRMLAGFAIVIGGVLNMAVFPIITAQFLTAFLGLPATVAIAGMNVHVPYLIMGTVLGLALVFLFVGGFVTVVATNYVQAIILSVSVFAITFLCFKELGGDSVSEITTKVREAVMLHRGEGAFKLFSKGGYGVVWVLFFVLHRVYSSLAFPPALVMTSGAKNTEVARKMFLIKNVYNEARLITIAIWGVVILTAWGVAVPEGYTAANYEQAITPLFLFKIVPPVLIGIILAGLVFAEISTTSTYLLSWCTIIINDVICPMKKKAFTVKHHILALRISYFAVAAFLFGWGIYYQFTESVFAYMYLTGAIFVGAGIITYWGLYWKKTSTLAAYLALIICMVIPLADVLLKQQWQNIAFLANWRDSYPLKSEESGLLAIVLAMVVIVIASLCSKKPTRFVDYGKKLKEMEA
ncbi:sodium:solute symporter [Planctomycetota bacterium]